MPPSDDRLLYALSGRRQVSWNGFKEIFSALEGKQEDVPQNGIALRRYLTRQALDALGHCDFDFVGGGRVYVSPPVLARLPVPGLPQAVLTGARSPETLPRIEEVCRGVGPRVSVLVDDQYSPLPLLPQRILVQADDEGQLAEVAKEVRIDFASIPPAWSLAHLAPDLSSYMTLLKWQSIPEPGWKRRDFDSGALHFSHPRSAKTDLRLSRYLDPVRNTEIHWLWKGSEHATVDPDWGRFAILDEARVSVLFYSQRRCRLAYHPTVPLPKLAARALGLCSGFAPVTADASRFRDQQPPSFALHAFLDVPAPLAGLLAGRLHQSLQELRFRLATGVSR